jgi:hypothetical protein
MERLKNIKNQIIVNKTLASIDKDNKLTLYSIKDTRKYHHFDKIDEVKAILWDNINFEALNPRLRFSNETLQKLPPKI